MEVAHHVSPGKSASGRHPWCQLPLYLKGNTQGLPAEFPLVVWITAGRWSEKRVIQVYCVTENVQKCSRNAESEIWLRCIRQTTCSSHKCIADVTKMKSKLTIVRGNSSFLGTQVETNRQTEISFVLHCQCCKCQWWNIPSSTERRFLQKHLTHNLHQILCVVKETWTKCENIV